MSVQPYRSCGVCDDPIPKGPPRLTYSVPAGTDVRTLVGAIDPQVPSKDERICLVLVNGMCLYILYFVLLRYFGMLATRVFGFKVDSGET